MINVSNEDANNEVIRVSRQCKDSTPKRVNYYQCTDDQAERNVSCLDSAKGIFSIGAVEYCFLLNKILMLQQ